MGAETLEQLRERVQRGSVQCFTDIGPDVTCERTQAEAKHEELVNRLCELEAEERKGKRK